MKLLPKFVTYLRKGNEAYASRNYELAIQLYGEGLKVDPDNAVLFSNRRYVRFLLPFQNAKFTNTTTYFSACFAALKQWQKAYDDAVMSVSKDPKFIKGYFRLSAAQTELLLFDDAETTLKAALALEPGISILHVCIKCLRLIRPLSSGNELAAKQIKSLKAKKQAAATAAKTKKAPKKLDEAQMKEV